MTIINQGSSSYVHCWLYDAQQDIPRQVKKIDQTTPRYVKYRRFQFFKFKPLGPLFFE